MKYKQCLKKVKNIAYMMSGTVCNKLIMTHWHIDRKDNQSIYIRYQLTIFQFLDHNPYIDQNQHMIYRSVNKLFQYIIFILGLCILQDMDRTYH